jgi:hypothetical protein
VDNRNIYPIWRWSFFAAALEAGAAILALARIPSEGLSPARLTMFVFLGLFLFAGLFFTVKPPSFPAPRMGRILFFSAVLTAFCVEVAVFLLRFLSPALMPYYERLLPVMAFLLVFSLQSCVLLLILRHGFHPTMFPLQHPLFSTTLAIFSILLGLLLFISISRLGLTPDPAYWGEPGIPIQDWQFGIVLFGGMLAFIISGPNHKASGRQSVWISIAIYFIAVALWLSIPRGVVKNGFYVSLDPPTYQPFPYSDAGYYDTMAQSLLIGHPYQGQIPTRPLYIVLLAVLHLLFGQDYHLILVGQTLVLAVIPVLLYRLGEKIHSHAAGAIAALFMIFRELTGILVSSETRVSNTRMLLVDLPTLMLVLISCLLVLRWLQRRDTHSAFLAGGSFGVLLLLRTQSLLILPFILIMAAMVFGVRHRPLYLLSLFFVLGLMVCISPWLLHNFVQSGQLSLDADFQYKVIATQYAYTGNLDIASFDFEGKGVAQILLQFLLKDPGFVLGFILNHFLAIWVDGLLAFPIVSSSGIFVPIDIYWTSWNGSLAWYSFLLVVLYLAVIALGLAAAWRRWRWIGLLPLTFSTGYALATAIGRFSGWRYDLPADWTPYFYFAIGFAEFIKLLTLLLGSKELDDVLHLPAPNPEVSARNLFASGLALVFLGALPWIATAFSVPRYIDQSPDVLLSSIVNTPVTPSMDELRAFLSNPDAVVVEGRLLYPRFFPRGTGKTSSRAWPSYASRAYPRQGFLLLNQSLTDALFRTREPLDFPQGADAILLGCQKADYIEARLVVFPEFSTAYLNDPLTKPCPQ